MPTSLMTLGVGNTPVPSCRRIASSPDGRARRGRLGRSRLVLTSDMFETYGGIRGVVRITEDTEPVVEIDDHDPVLEPGLPTVVVGVLGAGYWGPYLVRNILAQEGAELRYVCDLDRSRAAKVVGMNRSVRVTTAAQDVIDDPSVEAVAVATPPATHYELALQA